MEVIEQERIRRRFSQAVNTYDDHADARNGYAPIWYSY